MLSVLKDIVGDRPEPDVCNLYAGFFQDLSGRAALDRFAEIQVTPGSRPGSSFMLALAANQQNLAIALNDAANTRIDGYLHLFAQSINRSL